MPPTANFFLPCKNTQNFEKLADGTIKIVAKQEITTDEKCEKCSSPMVMKTGRFGKFLACSAYPECKFVAWQRPVAEPCPRCQATFLTERIAKGGRPVRMCVREGCGFRQEVEPTVA